MMTQQGTANGRTKPRVLVIFPGALGDFICFVPALKTIARRHREAQVELMAQAELARFAVGRAGVAQGHSIDRRELIALFGAGDDLEARNFFGQFHYIYSFFAAKEPAVRQKLEELLRGAVSFGRFQPPGEGHMAERYLRELGEVAGPLDASLAILPEELASSAAHLGRLGLKAGGYVLILPGSGSPSKNWPAEKFVALCRALAQETCPLAIVGQAESAMASVFASNTVAVLEGLGLGEILALASGARAFVGNDSGVSHLAAASGVAGVVCFGPTEPRLWRPLGRVKVICRENLPSIEPSEVVEALRALWRSRPD